MDGVDNSGKRKESHPECLGIFVNVNTNFEFFVSYLIVDQ